MAHTTSLDNRHSDGRTDHSAPLRTTPALRHHHTGQPQASAEPDSSQRESTAVQARITQSSSEPLPPSEAIMRTIRHSIMQLQASPDAGELSRMAPVPLVALGHFDRVLYWQVDGPLLVPVSAAFADGTTPSRYVVDDAFASPVSVEHCSVEAAAIHGAHQAAVSNPHANGPLSLLLGAKCYAVAVVKRGEDAVGVLQAAHQTLDADRLDRELLWSFAEICSEMMQRHAVTGQLNRQNRMIRALLHSVTDADDSPPTLEPAHSNGLTPGGNAGDQKAAEVLAPLTRREREVFQLLLRGAPNAEIARELVIADATVKSHVQSILHKFGVANRSQAIVRYNAVAGDNMNSHV